MAVSGRSNGSAKVQEARTDKATIECECDLL